MNASRPARKPEPTPLGELLRHWRNVRAMSQLSLALEANISQRQLSFIESGRSVPGRQTLLAIAVALDVPLRERNNLLLAAGYAPLYSASPWNADDMQSINRALSRVLRQHEPFPAIVMDRHWNVLMTNDAAPRFFNAFIDLSARKQPRNMLHLMFDPLGMRPHLADWRAVACSLLQRVQRETVGRVIDPETKQLIDDLLAYDGVPSDWKTWQPMAAAAASPMIPLGFLKDGAVLSYFSMVMSVGAPATVAAEELRVECMFPADDLTEAKHAALLGSER